MVARATSLLLTALFAVLLVAGCGGGDEDRALSRREYIDRSNELQQQAASVFATLDGRVATTPAQAERYLAAFDELIAGLEALNPPAVWRDEHATMLSSVRTMREAMSIVARAAPTNTPVITTQLKRSLTAQRRFEEAVQDVNASR